MDALVSESIDTKTHIHTTLLSDWISTASAPELTIQPNKRGHELFQRILNLIFDYYSTATSVLTILRPLPHDKGITKSLDVARTQKMSRDWRPVLTTYRRGHTWLTDWCYIKMYVRTNRVKGSIHASYSRKLESGFGNQLFRVFVVWFRSLYINAGIPDYSKRAKNASCQFIATCYSLYYVHLIGSLKQAITLYEQLRQRSSCKVKIKVKLFLSTPWKHIRGA